MGRTVVRLPRGLHHRLCGRHGLGGSQGQENCEGADSHLHFQKSYYESEIRVSDFLIPHNRSARAMVIPGSVLLPKYQ